MDQLILTLLMMTTAPVWVLTFDFISAHIKAKKVARNFYAGPWWF